MIPAYAVRGTKNRILDVSIYPSTSMQRTSPRGVRSPMSSEIQSQSVLSQSSKYKSKKTIQSIIAEHEKLDREAKAKAHANKRRKKNASVAMTNDTSPRLYRGKVSPSSAMRSSVFAAEAQAGSKQAIMVKDSSLFRRDETPGIVSGGESKV
jgi:hypothetical protein